ncbi:TPA: type I toxin-antitoxin system toxin IbsC [Escherichia coli]|nr:type I toxin-antitoxin system toxin IbsC [Escherichia coli]
MMRLVIILIVPLLISFSAY